DKLDALWFAPEYRPGPPPCLLLHNCPFVSTAVRAPEVVCQLHSGMINGSLEELGSAQRLTDLTPQAGPHVCEGRLGPAGAAGEHVRLHTDRLAELDVAARAKIVGEQSGAPAFVESPARRRGGIAKVPIPAAPGR
ncbi:MAG: hypothetical protein LBM66_00105, partial [Bifidobacteriaceae bacterium]|nr:hypothetical protein [Bifidobacteriaceae bacterium]